MPVKSIYNLSALLLLLFCTCATANNEDILHFDTEDQRQRYIKLTEELRCLVCQNQNLADSDAGLANDLRDELYKMVQANQSDEAIIDFMVTRYGDFVLYQPPVNITTVLLWFGPFVLISIVTFLLVLFLLRRSEQSQPKSLSPAQQQRLNTLLNKDKDS